MDLHLGMNYLARRSSVIGKMIALLVVFVGIVINPSVGQDGGHLRRDNASFTILNLTFHRNQLPFNITVRENLPPPLDLILRGPNPDVTQPRDETNTQIDDVTVRNVTVCIGGYGYPRSCPRAEDPAEYTRCCRDYDKPACCEERAGKVCASRDKGLFKISGWHIHVNTTYNVISCPRPWQSDDYTSCAFTNEDIGCFSRVTSTVIIWCLIAVIAFIFPIAFTIFVVHSIHKENQRNKEFLIETFPMREVVIGSGSVKINYVKAPKKVKKMSKEEAEKREQIKKLILERRKLEAEMKLLGEADEISKNEVTKVEEDTKKVVEVDVETGKSSFTDPEKRHRRRKRTKKSGRERERRRKPSEDGNPYFNTSSEIQIVNKARDEYNLVQEKCDEERSDQKEIVIVHDVPVEKKSQESLGSWSDDNKPTGEELEKEKDTFPETNLTDSSKNEVDVSEDPLPKDFERFDQGYNSMRERKRSKNVENDPRTDILASPDILNEKLEALLNGDSAYQNGSVEDGEVRGWQGARPKQVQPDEGGAKIEYKPKTQKMKQRAFSRSDTGYDSMKDGPGEQERKRSREESAQKNTFIDKNCESGFQTLDDSELDPKTIIQENIV